MKFEVSKASLKKAVSIISPAVSSSGSDISTHFLFRVVQEASTEPDLQSVVETQTVEEYRQTTFQSRGVVALLGYSGRLFASTHLTECTLSGGKVGDAFTVEGKRLKMLLASINNDPISFEFKEGEVKAKTSIGTNVFSSLDPNTFPYWDTAISKAKKEATLNIKKFKSALSYCSKFVSDQANKVPNICVVEYRNGTWFSTDQVVLASVYGPTDSCNFRIFWKDVTPVLSYINEVSSYDDEIEVFTSDRLVAFKAGSNSKHPCVFGHSLYRHVFPDLGVNINEKDHYVWSFDKKHLLSRIQFLNAGSKWDDPRLKFNYLDGGVKISAPSVSGGEISVDLELKNQVSHEDSPEFDESGFFVSHPYLTRVIGSIPGDDIEMRINIKKDKKKGWVRFKWEVDKSVYHALIAWQINF